MFPRILVGVSATRREINTEIGRVSGVMRAPPPQENANHCGFCNWPSVSARDLPLAGRRRGCDTDQVLEVCAAALDRLASIFSLSLLTPSPDTPPSLHARAQIAAS